MEYIGSWMTYDGQFRRSRITMRVMRWVTSGGPGLVAIPDEWAFFAHTIVLQYMT